MVDNKTKTSLFRHIQKKYITHEDYQYNASATHLYNIVIFIHEIFFLYSVYIIWEVFLNLCFRNVSSKMK